MGEKERKAAGNTPCRLSAHANVLRGACQALLLFIILLPQYFHSALFIDEQTDKLTDWQTDRLADKCERETDRERERARQNLEEMCLKHSYGNCKWIFQYLLIDSRTQFAYDLMPVAWHTYLFVYGSWMESARAGECLLEVRECHQQALWMTIGKMWAVNIYEATYLWHMSIMLYKLP